MPAQLHKVVRFLEGQFSEAAAILENAEVDVLAHTAFPRSALAHDRADKPLERINEQTKGTAGSARRR